MSSTKHIIENYLRIIDIEEPVLNEILDSLEKHPGYPSIKSLAETLEEWGLKFNIISGEKEDLISLGDFFIAVHKGTYVFVTKTEQEEIIYLNDKGFIIKERYEVFNSGWNKMAFWVDKPKHSPIHRIKTGQCGQLDKPTLKNIKTVSFGRVEPYTYQFFRRFSIYFTYLFVRLKIKPGAITILWTLTLLLTSYLLASGSAKPSIRFLSLILIFLHFIWDCTDGEVARITNKVSKSGYYLERVMHWITNMTIILGISYGLFNQSGKPVMLLLGLICIIGDTCFHLIFSELNYWVNPEIRYNWLQKITKVVYFFMPLNINIIILGCLFNQVFISLIFWCSISILLFVLVSVSFFSKEYSMLRKSAKDN